MQGMQTPALAVPGQEIDFVRYLGASNSVVEAGEALIRTLQICLA
jgi:hypothetical protein